MDFHRELPCACIMQVEVCPLSFWQTCPVGGSKQPASFLPQFRLGCQQLKGLGAHVPERLDALLAKLAPLSMPKPRLRLGDLQH